MTDYLCMLFVGDGLNSGLCISFTNMQDWKGI
jgi:hypothetical protein